MELAAFLNLVIVGATTVSLLGGREFVRRQNQHRLDGQRATFALTFPNKLDAKQVHNWMHTISGQPHGGAFGGAPATAFEVCSSEYGFRYRLHVPMKVADYVVNGLQTMAPGTHVVPDETELEHRWTYIVEYGEAMKGMPLYIPSPETVVATILNSMQNLGRGDEMLMQLVVTPAGRQKLPTYKSPPHTNSIGWGMLMNALATSKEEIEARRAKLQQPNMEGVIRIAVAAASVGRANELLHRIETAFGSVQTPHQPHNYLKRVGWASDTHEGSHLLYRLANASGYTTYPAQFSQSEVVALCAWPMGEPNVLNLPQSKARLLPVAPHVARGDQPGDVVIADSNVPGRERPIAMTMRGTTMHTYISAPTGGGKSVALANGFASVVASPFECGALVLETTNKPDDLLHRTLDYVPPERVERGDVVVIDLTDDEYAVAVNLFENGSPEVVADNLQNLFDELYRHNAGTLTVPEAIHHGVIALMTTTAAPYKLSFVDLMLLFRPRSDVEYELGQRIATNVPDREVREFWRSTYAANPTPEKMQAYFRPLARRIWQLNSRKQLRALFGQSHSAVNIYDAIRQHKIIEVNVGGLGDSIKNIVGAMFIDLVWDAVKRGAASPERPFHLFIDEFQNYPNLARNADVMLSEGRGFGLALWLANQGLYQLPLALQNAVTNNARNKWVMQQDDANAAMFARQFGRSVSADDIGGLPAHVAIARVIGNDGGLTAPFTAQMRPPVAGFGLGERARHISRLKFGRPIAEVEEELERRWRVEPQPKQKRPPLGKKGG